MPQSTYLPDLSEPREEIPIISIVKSTAGVEAISDSRAAVFRKRRPLIFGENRPLTIGKQCTIASSERGIGTS